MRSAATLKSRVAEREPEGPFFSSSCAVQDGETAVPVAAPAPHRRWHHPVLPAFRLAAILVCLFTLVSTACYVISVRSGYDNKAPAPYHRLEAELRGWMGRAADGSVRKDPPPSYFMFGSASSAPILFATGEAPLNVSDVLPAPFSPASSSSSLPRTPLFTLRHFESTWHPRGGRPAVVRGPPVGATEGDRAAPHDRFVFFIHGNAGGASQGHILLAALDLHAALGQGPTGTSFHLRSYTFDLAEQASVHRGGLLGRQADFVSHAVQRVVAQHTPRPWTSHDSARRSVWLVGHSMGGIVARVAASLVHASGTGVSVDGVLTINTPHRYPPLLLDGPMQELYTALQHTMFRIPESNETLRGEHDARRDSRAFVRACVTGSPACRAYRPAPRLTSLTSGVMDLQIEPETTIPACPLVASSSGDDGNAPLCFFANMALGDICGHADSHDGGIRNACMVSYITTLLHNQSLCKRQRGRGEACLPRTARTLSTREETVGQEAWPSTHVSALAWLGRVLWQRHLWPAAAVAFAAALLLSPCTVLWQAWQLERKPLVMEYDDSTEEGEDTQPEHEVGVAFLVSPGQSNRKGGLRDTLSWWKQRAVRERQRRAQHVAAVAVTTLLSSPGILAAFIVCAVDIVLLFCAVTRPAAVATSSLSSSSLSHTSSQTNFMFLPPWVWDRIVPVCNGAQPSHVFFVAPTSSDKNGGEGCLLSPARGDIFRYGLASILLSGATITVGVLAAEVLHASLGALISVGFRCCAASHCESLWGMCKRHASTKRDEGGSGASTHWTERSRRVTRKTTNLFTKEAFLAILSSRSTWTFALYVLLGMSRLSRTWRAVALLILSTVLAVLYREGMVRRTPLRRRREGLTGEGHDDASSSPPELSAGMEKRSEGVLAVAPPPSVLYSLLHLIQLHPFFTIRNEIISATFDSAHTEDSGVRIAEVLLVLLLVVPPVVGTRLSAIAFVRDQIWASPSHPTAVLRASLPTLATPSTGRCVSFVRVWPFLSALGSLWACVLLSLSPIAFWRLSLALILAFPCFFTCQLLVMTRPGTEGRWV